MIEAQQKSSRPWYILCHIKEMQHGKKTMNMHCSPFSFSVPPLTRSASLSSRKNYSVSLALTSPWLAAFRSLMTIGVEMGAWPVTFPQSVLHSSPPPCPEAPGQKLPINTPLSIYFQVCLCRGGGGRLVLWPVVQIKLYRKYGVVSTLVKYSESSKRHRYGEAWRGWSLIYWREGGEDIGQG